MTRAPLRRVARRSTRRIARMIADAALAAVDAGHAIREHVRRRGRRLTVCGRRYDLDRFDRVLVFGAGKAAAAMAGPMERLLGGSLTGGLVITKRGHAAPLSRIEVREAGHPLPDDDGVRAAEALIKSADGCTERDLVFFLVSGGASSLLTAPAPGLTLHDLQRTTALLLACGATIHEMNGVRKHLSAIAGGRLARLIGPATLITLAVSDVVGDAAGTIGSGPTAPDPTTYADARAVLARYRLEREVPPAVLDQLQRGGRGLLEETPKPTDPAFARFPRQYEVIATNRLALTRAAAQAKQLGFRPLVLTDSVTGEAKEAAKFMIAIGRSITEHHQPVRPPACVLLGGETTVSLAPGGNGTTPRGHGGRNQEFALAAALAMGGLDRLLALSLATDGDDGVAPPDRPAAAGAFADGTTVSRARSLGLDPDDALMRHDAYPFFDRLGDLVVTGPTRTNVMDLHLLLVA
ncbi:MAG: glycerate kinase [Nitrospirae bacterium]|nr:glycerate kinase [Nitrospirota bacterium]